MMNHDDMTGVIATEAIQASVPAATTTLPPPPLTLLLQITSTNGTTALDALEAAALELKAFRFPEPGWNLETKFYTIKALPVEETGGGFAVPREASAILGPASHPHRVQVLVLRPADTTNFYICRKLSPADSPLLVIHRNKLKFDPSPASSST